MDCKKTLAILAAICLALPASAQGAQHIVGDGHGWTLNFNYTAWAEGKEFRVGDTLAFTYAVGKHNVFKVSGPDFQACKVPPDSEALTSGSDVISLMTPGRKWYICGKAYGQHCQMGQKLVINVLPAAEQTPPACEPPSTEHAPTWEAPAVAPSYPAPPMWVAPAPATQSGPRKFYVGDDKGWTLNFDYMGWAQGKEFRVGDVLVFNYPVGVHNVFKVDGPSFQACKVPRESEALTTGNDMITLATPGMKWYICGKAHGKHCQMGQKLVINVLPAAGQPPAQSPPSGYTPSLHRQHSRRLFK